MSTHLVDWQFLGCLALFGFLCCEGAWWLRDAIKPREWVKPLALIGSGFYFLSVAVIRIL